MCVHLSSATRDIPQALPQILTVCAWGWLSDRTGRKPVLLAPFQLAALASLAFGFGHSFAVLLLLRSVQGLMNGPEAVVKTVLAEMTDETK